MSDHFNDFDPKKKTAGAKRLADDLAGLDRQDSPISAVDRNMLSLIVSEVLSGEDISRRHPALYRRLLASGELRQAFLDLLESVEAERDERMARFPGALRSLDFLQIHPDKPSLEFFDRDRWRTTWERSLEQLQALFSPPKLAYRADPEELEDPWFTLLRDEVQAGGTSYAVALECTLSSEIDRALAGYLTLAITLESPDAGSPFPLSASLSWGAYEGSVLINEEGRARFPDIPLATILEKEGPDLGAGLRLVLQKA
jgi:hypothetical protein